MRKLIFKGIVFIGPRSDSMEGGFGIKGSVFRV